MGVKEKVFIDCPKRVCIIILVSSFIPCYQKFLKFIFIKHITAQ